MWSVVAVGQTFNYKKNDFITGVVKSLADIGVDNALRWPLKNFNFYKNDR